MPIKTPHKLTTMTVTDQTIKAGARMANDVWAWMECNKGAFFEIYDFVKSLQARHTTGRVRDRVAVHCMTHGIEVDDDPYKFANAKFAGIARYMALMDPSLMDAPLRFNDSLIDCFGLLPVSYLDLEE